MPPKTTTTKSRRRERRAWTPTFPDIDLGVCSTAAVRNLIGDFLEAATAEMVEGRILANDFASGANPDVEDPRGRLYESKASCSSRWLCSAEQHDRLVELGAWYMLWGYKRPWPQGETPTDAATCRRGIADNVMGCYVLPAAMLRDLIAQTKHPEPVYANTRWARGGKYSKAYYWVSRECFRRIGRGTHRLQPRLLVHRRHRHARSVRDTTLHDHTAFWITYRDDVERQRHPVKRGWIATDADVAMATIALHEMETHRLTVAMVPATRRNFPGHKIRVATGSNPRWYRTLVYRRPQAPRRKSHSIRLYVERALRSIIATRYIRPSPKTIDLEVLDCLHDDEHIGTDQTAAP